ncbi:MAG: bifunctional 4-hydroxy-3-methylbut-2-enyl diphosphate reductase/30S ribosomal protein S1 [Oscillospiraceae bacterium]|nr:bifunctional 4-hydroxy-3-methylbut-2-enyl diphosphate reductase/30S ribosomal protein S1 [Oscillospiraceae bacterium]
MKITLAKTAGFCFGVDRAVKTLEKLANNGQKVCTLGPIIHNPQVVEHFKNKGVNIINDISELKDDTTVVLRTHGVEATITDYCEKNGIKYIDAACPFVKKIHKIVLENTNENTPLLIAGDKNHPEVIGIASRAKGDYFTFNSAEELENLLNNHQNLKTEPVILVSQTTFSIKEWKKCVEIANLLCTNALIFDTICNATEERQTEALVLSKKNDAMIIIGGRTSSNTAKLKAVCEQNCLTYLIETADELLDIDFSGIKSIGVTAGASTPDSTIKEVINTMSEFNEKGNPMNDEFQQMLDESFDKMTTGKYVAGTVVGFTNTEIQVEIPGKKHAGYVPFDEYSDDPTADPKSDLKIGDEVKLIIMSTNDAEGTMKLSKRLADRNAIWEDLEADDTVREGKVTGIVGENKGVYVQCGAIRVFVPASLAKARKNDNLEDLVGTTVEFKIIEVEKNRRRVVGSIREVAAAKRREIADAFWANVAEGNTYTGTVRSLTAYGAFVDLGGVDGMIHISELSWTRIKHPSEVLSVGDTVEVYVKALDTENKKISLGYKKIEDNPWEILKRDYPVDSEIECKIVSITSFGAFAQIIPGVDGLIHISQIAYKHIGSPAEVLKVGETVKAKIMEIDFDKKRVSLSIKALLPPPVIEEVAVAEESADVAEETPVEAVEEAPVAEEVPTEEANSAE